MNNTLSQALSPSNFNQMTLLETQRNTFIKMKENQIIPSMLFYGEPGTGKTETAKLLIDDDFDCLNLNAASISAQNFIKTVENYAKSSSLISTKKAMIIEDVDTLSRNHQLMLKDIINKCTNICIFILTTNVISKIDSSLQSRMCTFCFDPASEDKDYLISMYINNVKAISKERNLDIDIERAHDLAEMYFPDFRKIANMIEYR